VPGAAICTLQHWTYPEYPFVAPSSSSSSGMQHAVCQDVAASLPSSRVAFSTTRYAAGSGSSAALTVGLKNKKQLVSASSRAQVSPWGLPNEGQVVEGMLQCEPQ
jgi:hypothetical protein